MPRGFLLVALVAVALRSTAGPAMSAAAPEATAEFAADIRVGFGAHVVPDVWIPVSLRLRSEREIAGAIEVMTSQARPSGVERVRVAVHLTARTPLPVTVPAIVRDVHAPVVVRLFEGETARARWRITVPPARLAESVILGLSRRPVGLQRVLGEGGRVRVAYVSEEDLPARWQLYEGVRAVVIRDLDERRLVPAQVEALAGWVAAGGRLLIATPADDLPAASLLRPFLAAPALPPTIPAVPERVHPWGRGRVAVVPSDPFRPDLAAEDEAVWTRLLGEPKTPAFVDPRALLDKLPQSPGTSLGIQLMVVATLGLYLLLLRPMTRGLLRGRAGWVLAVALLVAATTAMSILNSAVRRGASTVVQGAIAVALPDRELALLESVGRIVLPRRGPFRLEANGEVLVRTALETSVEKPVRALPSADTTLILDPVVRFEGRGDSALPMRAVTLIPLPIRGVYREGPQGIEVQIENRSGRRLRDPTALLDDQIQSLPPLDPEGRATLSPLRWRKPPDVEAARGPAARVLAWTFGRLRGDAILSPTVYLVAWLDDDRGVLHWPNQPAAPLLLVLPLTRAEGAP